MVPVDDDRGLPAQRLQPFLVEPFPAVGFELLADLAFGLPTAEPLGSAPLLDQKNMVAVLAPDQGARLAGRQGKDRIESRRHLLPAEETEITPLSSIGRKRVLSGQDGKIGAFAQLCQQPLANGLFGHHNLPGAHLRGTIALGPGSEKSAPAANAMEARCITCACGTSL